jgi:GNAT superfamily N-acetyltransferase
MSIDVRRVRADEAERIRPARLASLAEEEFRSHFLRAEQQLTADDWAARAARGAQSGEFATFIALRDREVIGIAEGRLANEQTVEVGGMWVHPDLRGQSIGRRLLEAVSEWACGRGATSLGLVVVTTNEPARSLYARAGFAAVGGPQPARTAAGIMLQRMERRL